MHASEACVTRCKMTANLHLEWLAISHTEVKVGSLKWRGLVNQKNLNFERARSKLFGLST